MSEQDVFNLQLQKNTFYRDKFRKMMKLITLLVISATLLLATFIFQSLKRENVTYYGSSTNGEQTPLHALSDPVLTERLVTQWASIASKKAYQLNFEHYSSQLDAMKIYFTKAGWSSYNDAIQSSGFLSIIKSQKLEVDAIVTDEPVVKNTGVDHGVRYWNVEMPVLVSFNSASNSAQKKLIIGMKIVRSRDIAAPSGLQIEHFNTFYQ